MEDHLYILTTGIMHQTLRHVANLVWMEYDLVVGRNSIIHDRTNLLYEFWHSLEQNDIHPLAFFAHRKQESLIECESHAAAQALAQKLKKALRSSVANLSIAPYRLLHTDACILNPYPQFSCLLFNIVGLDHASLLPSLAEIFHSFIPFYAATYGPIVQSINIEKLIDSELYHVRFELRTDRQHVADENKVVDRFMEISLKSDRARAHVWSGGLQLQRRKNIIFYSKYDFTNSGAVSTLIEDPKGIQEAIAAGSGYLPVSEDLVALSEALKRIGYAQKLFIEGDVTEEEQNAKDTVSLSSILDEIADNGSINDTIIVHLDEESMKNSDAIRVTIRVSFYDLVPSISFPTFPPVKLLTNVKYDIFHLIGHLPDEVDFVYGNKEEDFYHEVNSGTCVPLIPPTPSLKESSEVSDAETGAKKEKLIFLETSVDELDQHPMFLYALFSGLATRKAEILRMDGIKLIQTLDVVVTLKSAEKPSSFASVVPNGVILLPTHPNGSRTTHVMTFAGPRITSTLIRSILEKMPKTVTDFRRLRQLSIASSSRAPYLSSKKTNNSETRDLEAQYETDLDIDCIELNVHAHLANQASEAEMRKMLMEIGLENSVDISFQPASWKRTNMRVAALDMDSTLIQLECIDEMANFCGVGDRVRQVTHRAMNGELDFTTALKERVLLLKNANAKQVFDYVLAQIKFTPHAKLLCHTLNALGYETAILSGGFYPIIRHVEHALRLKHWRANKLEIGPDGKLTGELASEHHIVDSKAKETFLRKMCARIGVDTSLSLAVGDGANDIPMLAAAGRGIAFLAKDTVRKHTNFHINFLTLAPVLFQMGFDRDECLNLLTDYQPTGFPLSASRH